MLVGHHSVSLAARADAPAVPLWAYVAAAQALDILWCLFIMAGIYLGFVLLAWAAERLSKPERA